MPLYEYACTQCNHHFDVRHGADDKPECSCPQCQGPIKKVFHAAGIIFKGSGWYVTDSVPQKTEAEKKDESGEKKEAASPANNTEPAKEPAATSA